MWVPPSAPPASSRPSRCAARPSPPPPTSSPSAPPSPTRRPPTRPSGTAVPRSCSTGSCTRSRTCRGSRTRWRPRTGLPGQGSRGAAQHAPAVDAAQGDRGARGAGAVGVPPAGAARPDRAADGTAPRGLRGAAHGASYRRLHHAPGPGRIPGRAALAALVLPQSAGPRRSVLPADLRPYGRPPGAQDDGDRTAPSRPDPRLMRQRLIVFVLVTLIVALGIAAAQKL